MPADRQPVRFGIFEVDLTEGVLRRKGERVKLQEQPFQVLAALLETPGRIVTKEQLQERIWKDDTFVDFDRSLATAVNKIRQALGDSASHPRYIETVPRRGYRFVGAGFPARPEVSATRPGSVRLAFVWAAGFVVTIAVAAFLLGRIGSEPYQPATVFVPRPLTSFFGGEWHPAISPSGDRVAFDRVSDDPDRASIDIWVQTIGSDDGPIRLTTDAQVDLSPTWSPDGSYLAFLRGFPGQAEIIRIPSIGGPEQKLGEAFFPAPVSVGLAFTYTYLDWSPDGEYLAVGLGPTSDDSSPHQLEIATGEITPLPRPEPRGIRGPVYAPDGRSIAYAMASGAEQMDIWLQDLSESGEPLGEARRLTWHETFMFGLDWTPDGREIVFVSRLEGIDRFWRVSVEPGEPEIVQISGRHGIQLSIDPQSRRFVFAQIADDMNIWSLPGPLAPDRGAVAPKQVVASTHDDKSAEFSPDGTRIVFVSLRTGSQEIWTAGADGTNVRRITTLNGPGVGSPRWSPDGQFVAIDGNIDGPRDIYIVRADGGEIRRVTASDSIDIRPSWSQDGQWIYFWSIRSRKGALWKIPVGGGDAIQVTEEGGNRSYETADGSLYYHKDVAGKGEVWRLAAGATTPEQVLPSVDQKMWTTFERGICFVQDIYQKTQRLSFYDFATETITPFAELPEGWHIEGSPGLSVSADGQQIVLTVMVERGGDVMLVEDFH